MSSIVAKSADQASGPANEPAERVFFLDSARALFMLLGIPFHASLIFGALGPWLISDPETSMALTFLGSLLHIFRMPGFFFIAGFFAAMLIARRGSTAWLHDRAIRLGVPFLVAALLLNPVQLWVEAVSHAHGPDVLETMGGILTLHPDRLMSHLWFLPALMLQCVFLAVAWRIIQPFLPRIMGWLQAGARLPGAVLVIAGSLALWSAGTVFVFDRSAFTELNFLSPLIDAISLLPWFLLGVAANIAPAVLDRVTHLGKSALILVLLATPLHIAVFLHPDFAHSYFWQTVSEPIAATGLVICLLAILRRHTDSHNPLVAALVAASFTIYLFHQPVILLLEYALIDITMPPLLKWALIVGITLPVCYAMHRIISLNRWVLFLFNGVRPGGRRAILRRAPG